LSRNANFRGLICEIRYWPKFSTTVFVNLFSQHFAKVILWLPNVSLVISYNFLNRRSCAPIQGHSFLYLTSYSEIMKPVFPLLLSKLKIQPINIFVRKILPGNSVFYTTRVIACQAGSCVCTYVCVV